MVTKRMNLEDLEKMDSKKMFKVYDIWPDIAKESYEQEFSKPEFDDIDHIVFSGMGGSGTMGDVFSSILSKNDIHTSVVKGYLLPKTVDENTLVVVTSVSGNTQEPLTVLKNSKNSKAKFLIISFTSDWLYPTPENKEIVIALNASGADVGFIEITSDKGHDSFLLDIPDFLKSVKNFLEANY